MIFDTDDLYEGHDRMDLLRELKAANPKFRMTAFAIPALCPDRYIDSLPSWIDPVPHGWFHGDPPTDGGECRDWTAGAMRALITLVRDRSPRWAYGFKAPGWVISDACYQPLSRAGWWIADQHYNDDRRPEGVRVHCEGDGDHAHSHVQNVCSNGIEETFPALLERVRAADSFELVSEVAAPWVAPVLA